VDPRGPVYTRPLVERTVTANGIGQRLFETGAGEPVVLLHGGLGSSEDWADQRPALAERFRVIAYDRRGHGRTAATPEPFDYDVMTADAVALLDELGLARARLVGFSDGGIVALLVALRRPDLVGRLVLIGANTRPDGLEPRMRGRLESSDAASYPERYRVAFERLSPDGPDAWPAAFAQTRRLWLEEPHITEEQLATVAAPTLVVAGDRDLIAPEHTVALFRALPRTARLAIVPGAGHDLPREQPALLNQLLLAFLSESG